jgi:hypothetical protein
MQNIREIIKIQLHEILNKENPILCDLNLEWAKNNYDEKLYGKFSEENYDVNRKMSKCLCLNNVIIGCYLLSKKSMLQSLKDVIYFIKEGIYTNLKFYISKEELQKYKNKRGIFSYFLYIDKNYRNKNYAHILIDYSNTLGDYVWGVTIKGEADKYWTEKQGRIEICEWKEEDGSISVLTATKV